MDTFVKSALKRNAKAWNLVIPESLEYFAFDKHGTAAGRNHTKHSSIKTKRRDAEVAEERREKQTNTSRKAPKKQYNEKVKTFLCVLCVEKKLKFSWLLAMSSRD